MVVPGPPNFDEWGKLVAKDPDFESHGPQFNCGDLTWQMAVEVGEWRSAESVGIGSLVEVLFDDGKWYPGKVESRDESGKLRIKFNDGDQQEVDANDPEMRIISAPSQFSQAGLERSSADPALGPWATWLDTYLPDLLHSSFRSARLGKVDKHLISRILDSGKATNPPNKRARGKA